MDIGLFLILAILNKAATNTLAYVFLCSFLLRRYVGFMLLKMASFVIFHFPVLLIYGNKIIMYWPCLQWPCQYPYFFNYSSIDYFSFLNRLWYHMRMTVLFLPLKFIYFCSFFLHFCTVGVSHSLRNSSDYRIHPIPYHRRKAFNLLLLSTNVLDCFILLL